MTNTSLSPGKTYQFRMSFFGGEVLEAVARVVWRERHGEEGSEPLGVPHGIEFTDINDSNLENLRKIIRAREFGSKEH
jgi:hypothetical protein